MMTTRKVLMLVENHPVPTDPRVWGEAVTLHNHGYQVSVICPKGTTNCRESYLCIENIHIYRYSAPSEANSPIGFILEYSIALIMTFFLSFKVLFRHGFDVVHSANPPDIFFIIGMFYRLFGKKFVFDQHDLAPEMLQVKYGDRLKFLQRALLFLEGCSTRTANLVIVTNLSYKRNAIQRGHCPAQKVFVVRNGPDLKRLEPIIIKPPDLQGKRRYLLAYIGTMAIQDGIHHALYALHELVHKRGHQDISLLLMGDGDCLPALKMLTQELHLAHYVHFTGWLESRETLSYLAIADIGISPDPQNGLNEFCTMIKTMEYMAMGKPVVAFDLAETRYSAQAAALYAVPNLVEDFASKIEILLEDEELRTRMGEIGRKRIEDALSWDHSAAHLLEAYKTLFSTSTSSEPLLPDLGSIIDEKLGIVE